MFRPGLIVPLHGIQSRTKLYRVIYGATAPLLRLLYPWLPKYMTTSEQLGRAMVEVAKRGSAKSVLESADINQV